MVIACTIALLSQTHIRLVHLQPHMELTGNILIFPDKVKWLSQDESGKTAAIHIKAHNADIDFKSLKLQGSAVTAEPDKRPGTALIIEGENITIRNLKTSGYKIGLIAKDVKGLNLVDSDLSYNWKQHLLSTPEKEDLSDWMSYHQNEKDEWLRYGMGVYLKGCTNFKVRNVTIVGGQCGLMMSNCSHGTVLNNNFSFLSGLGVGMYRTSGVKLMHNSIDWCVRGYSHGVYNRGQDSAGILVFEQCQKNTIAYNSVTHGGDGFFLWAGQSTMDTGTGGCNNNIIASNDFSHAPTNGIEATFSKNIFQNNLVQDCWHGVWGGYSFDSEFKENTFLGNEVGIAIEHGQNNRIVKNGFALNNIDVSLWQNASQDPNWGYPKHHDTESHGYLIQDNIFLTSLVSTLRFMGVRDVKLLDNLVATPASLINADARVRDLEVKNNGGNVTEKASQETLKKLASEYGDNEFTFVQLFAPLPKPITPQMVRPGEEKLTRDQYVAQFTGSNWKPDSVPRLPGGKVPFLPTSTLRGRRYIIVDEWGPYDFKSPRLVKREGHRFEVLGPPGKWRPKSVRGIGINPSFGTVPGWIEFTPQPGVSSSEIVLEYTGGKTTDYRGIVSPAGKKVNFGWSRFELPQSWNVRWWNYDGGTQDPRTQKDAFAAVRKGKPIFQEKVDHISYDWGGSPKPNVNADHFASTAEGAITAPKGIYVLSVTADDGVRVWLDGKLLIDEWHYSPPANYERTVSLNGKHEVRIEQFELDGYSTLKFAIRPKK